MPGPLLRAWELDHQSGSPDSSSVGRLTGNQLPSPPCSPWSWEERTEYHGTIRVSLWPPIWPYIKFDKEVTVQMATLFVVDLPFLWQIRHFYPGTKCINVWRVALWYGRLAYALQHREQLTSWGRLKNIWKDFQFSKGYRNPISLEMNGNGAFNVLDGF